MGITYVNIVCTIATRTYYLLNAIMVFTNAIMNSTILVYILQCILKKIKIQIHKKICTLFIMMYFRNVLINSF